MTTDVSGICPFCGLKAKKTRDISLNFVLLCYECPSCGVFVYDDTLEDLGCISNLNAFERRKIAAFLTEYRIQVSFDESHNTRSYRPQIPFIIHEDSDFKKEKRYIYLSFSSLIDSFPKTAIALFDRILLNLSKIINQGSPVTQFIINNVSHFAIFFAVGIDQDGTLSNFITICREMENLGYIHGSFDSSKLKIGSGGDGLLTGTLILNISTAGWQRLIEFQKEQPGMKPQAFVGMWFDSSRDEFFNNAIKSTIEESHKPDVSVAARRVDYDQHNDKICDHIISEIRRSRYAVIDVTGNNAGAYYEGGFAHGLGIPIIWAVEKNFLAEKGLHFDI